MAPSGMRLHMLEVRWKPSTELATTAENQPESAALLADQMLRVKAAHAEDPQRLDLDLTDLQQQGHEPRRGQPVMPWAPELAAKVHINTLQSASPDHDMLPTGLFCIYFRQGMAHVLRPDGTFIGRLAKARLDQLYQGFTKNTMTCLICPVCRVSGSSAISIKRRIQGVSCKQNQSTQPLGYSGHLHACTCRRSVHRH